MFIFQAYKGEQDGNLLLTHGKRWRSQILTENYGPENDRAAVSSTHVTVHIDDLKCYAGSSVR